jgi:hypothetical protein
MNEYQMQWLSSNLDITYNKVISNRKQLMQSNMAHYIEVHLDPSKSCGCMNHMVRILMELKL